MKTLFVVVVAAVALLTGCGKKATCDLSSVAIKSIVLDNDQGNFVRDAVAHELYARKARFSADKGVALKGRIEQDGQLVALNFSADSDHIAAATSFLSGVKKNSNYVEDRELTRFEPAAEAIAKRAVAQVCECVQGLDH